MQNFKNREVLDTIELSNPITIGDEEISEIKVYEFENAIFDAIGRPFLPNFQVIEEKRSAYAHNMVEHYTHGNLKKNLFSPVDLIVIYSTVEHHLANFYQAASNSMTEKT